LAQHPANIPKEVPVASYLAKSYLWLLVRCTEASLNQTVSHMLLLLLVHARVAQD
jgi:hypothetical protein